MGRCVIRLQIKIKGMLYNVQALKQAQRYNNKYKYIYSIWQTSRRGSKVCVGGAYTMMIRKNK